MVPLETVFLGLVVFFAIIGALRGWAKELLVIFDGSSRQAITRNFFTGSPL